jgi:hypothetical protein
MCTQQQVSLIGTWRLTSVEARYEDSSVIYPWGPNARGFLIYTQDGYMSAMIMRADRPRFLVSDMLGGSIEEQAQAAQSYLSYGGTYEIQGDKIIHHIEASLFPNWVGEDQVRFVDKLTKDQLMLRTQPYLTGGKIGTGYLVWYRA